MVAEAEDRDNEEEDDKDVEALLADDSIGCTFGALAVVLVSDSVQLRACADSVGP